jgi:Cytochrome c
VKQTILLAGVLVFGAAACSPQVASDTPTVAVTLPTGDTQAGRQAVLDLKCSACHQVPSEPTFPAPVSANPGPPFDGRLATRDLSYLATAIVSPSHQLSADVSTDVRAQLEGALSPMGDYSRVMTVRQMVDLHAYLRAIR